MDEHLHQQEPEIQEEEFTCQRICPQCGKQLYTVKLGFCPYCGSSLADDRFRGTDPPSEIQSEVRRLRSEYDAMEEELEIVQNEYTHLRQSFDGLLSERNRLADENTQLRRRLKETSRDLQQWMLGTQGLNQRLQEITVQYAAAAQEVQKLRHRLETASARKSADAEAAQDTLKFLQNELEALRYELRAKDKEVQKYRAVSRKVPDLEEQKALLSDMVAQRDAEIEHLRERCEGKPDTSALSEHTRDEELLRSNIELKTRLFNLTEQQNRIKEELADAQDKIQALHVHRSVQERAMQAQAEESARAIAAVRQEADDELATLRNALAIAEGKQNNRKGSEAAS